MERRPPGSCFRCGDAGHVYKQCPKNPRRRVGAIQGTSGIRGDEDEEDELRRSLDAVQLVTVAFISSENKCTVFNKCYSLLDTGNPVSSISRSMLPEVIQVGDCRIQTTRLGNVKLYTYGIIFCYLKLAKQIRKVPFMIIPDRVTPMPLLIGRDILSIFNITLKFNLTLGSA